MSGTIEEVCLIALSRDAHRTVCGLVQPTEVVDSEEVFAADEVWAEIRDLFPAAGATVSEDEAEPLAARPRKTRIMVLEDGESYSDIEGCRIFDVPTEWDTEEIEDALAEEVRKVEHS